MATFNERANLMAKKRQKDDMRFEYYEKSPKHWPDLRDKKHSWHRKDPLWKIHHKIPIRLVEYRALLKRFRRKGVPFTYPIEKINFIEERILILQLTESENKV